jgi:hypothetical protein
LMFTPQGISREMETVINGSHLCYAVVHPILNLDFWGASPRCLVSSRSSSLRTIQYKKERALVHCLNNTESD